MHDKLITLDDRWDRLVAAARSHPYGNIFLDLIEAVEMKLTEDLLDQQARFDAYMPKRPADEPHDAGCQFTRMGEMPGLACTCASNMLRRRAGIAAAGVVHDRAFRATLGSMEQAAFDRAARVVGVVPVMTHGQTWAAQVRTPELNKGDGLTVDANGCLTRAGPDDFVVAKMVDDYDGGPTVFFDPGRKLAASDRKNLSGR